MNFKTTIFLKSLTAGLALAALPLGFSQIPDEELDSIFSRLNGDDYDARYAARIDLQDHVSDAGSPGNKKQRALVEAQLLERLDAEPLLTTKLWLLRKISSIGSKQSLPALEGLLSSADPTLADAARQAISVINYVERPMTSLVLSDRSQELAALLAGDANRSVKTAAFEKLSKKSAKLARAVLQEDPQPEYLKIAVQSQRASLRKIGLAELASGDVSRQIVVLGALRSRVAAKLEEQIIALLASDNETLKIQAIETLGRVGTLKSLDPILQLIAAKSRDVSDTAADAITALNDSRIDKQLLSAARKGDTDSRIKALKALSYRASVGAADVINSIAADTSLDKELRKEAIENTVLIGNLESMPILVSIIVDPADAALRRDAQKAIKRMTLRTGSPDLTWAAFKDGFDAAASDAEAQVALIMVVDSAPTDAAVAFLVDAYSSNDEAIQKAVLRVLPSWRNWGGAHGLLKLVETDEDNDALRLQCLKGVGSLILGSDETYPIPEKFKVADAALGLARSDAEKKAVLDGFRFVTGKDKRQARGPGISPELQKAVLAGGSK